MKRIAWLILTSAGGAWAGPQSADLPAREMLLVINQAEVAAEKKAVESLGPQGVRWEVTAMPQSTRSWLYFNVPREGLESLERNIDDEGKPLL